MAAYKCTSWHFQLCKDNFKWLTPDSDGSNVTGVYPVRQGYHNVFVDKLSSL